MQTPFELKEQLIINMQAEQYADEYKLHLLLGEGGQANVYLGSKANALYAVKVYHPGASKEDAFKIEVDFLTKLNFPHLINIVDSRINATVKTHARPEEKRPVIVLELAEGGELFDFLSKLGKFTPEVCRAYTKQLVAAIRYLAEVGVSHRDLKPENILFDSQFQLKVSDFGLSRDAKGNNNDFQLSSRVGTEGYKPPEMEAGKYTGLQADIFATGVVLFIMYNGTPPFLSTKGHDRIYKLIKDKNFVKFWALHEKNKPPGFYPDAFKRLMNSFLSAEPDRRPSFESLEHDEWMKGDDLMSSDLFAYMKAKADKLVEKDENKQKIAVIKKELFLNRAMQEECCGDQSRGDEDEENPTEQALFGRNYRALKIPTESLPQYTKKRVVYIKQNPAFVVAWLQDHLAALLKSKETFITYADEIEPNAFSLEYLEEKHQVVARLGFTVGEDGTELELVGQLHRSEKGEVGIEWTKTAGNDYWLTAIQNSLNGSLETIA